MTQITSPACRRDANHSPHNSFNFASHVQMDKKGLLLLILGPDLLHSILHICMISPVVKQMQAIVSIRVVLTENLGYLDASFSACSSEATSTIPPNNLVAYGVNVNETTSESTAPSLL
jgi:hypothetical protein